MAYSDEPGVARKLLKYGLVAGGAAAIGVLISPAIRSMIADADAADTSKVEIYRAEEAGTSDRVDAEEAQERAAPTTAATAEECQTYLAARAGMMCASQVMRSVQQWTSNSSVYFADLGNNDASISRIASSPTGRACRRADQWADTVAATAYSDVAERARRAAISGVPSAPLLLLDCTDSAGQHAKATCGIAGNCSPDQQNVPIMSLASRQRELESVTVKAGGYLFSIGCTSEPSRVVLTLTPTDPSLLRRIATNTSTYSASASISSGDRQVEASIIASFGSGSTDAGSFGVIVNPEDFAPLIQVFQAAAQNALHISMSNFENALDAAPGADAPSVDEQMVEDKVMVFPLADRSKDATDLVSRCSLVGR